MCLSCGKQFKNDQEAQDHNEYYKQKELETRWVLTAKTTTKYAVDANGVFREVENEEIPQYVPAHVVQIHGSVGVG